MHRKQVWRAKMNNTKLPCSLNDATEFVKAIVVYIG